MDTLFSRNSSGILCFVATICSSLVIFPLVHQIITKKRHSSEIQNVKYHGQCHCGKIKFSAVAPKHLTVWDCNCSICYMKKNAHFIVPKQNFRILDGEETITTYTFNTNVAKHMFCSICGVQAFYIPRSNPDGMAVTFACLLPNEIHSYEIKKFDGQNWEDFIDKADIKKYSKC